MLANPTQTIPTPERLWAALAARHGPDVFSRFFHACADAADRGELDFIPGRHLTRGEILRLMSRAASEDLTPLFSRCPQFHIQP